MISVNFKYVSLAAAMFAAVLFSSCLPEDVVMELPEYRPGETKVNHMDESIYTHVAYFDLSTDTFVRMESKMLWDLAFENGADAWHITLNSAKRMYIANTGKTRFDAYTEQTGSEVWRWDNSNGNLDSTALVNWAYFSNGDTLAHDSVFVVNLGVDEKGVQQGFKKIQFLGIENGVYSFRFGDLADTEGTLFRIPKTGNESFIMFSMAGSGTIRRIEPEARGWDLLFAQYTTILYTNDGTPVPYFVQGVSINQLNGVKVAPYTEKDFAEIKIEDVPALPFTDKKDIIGHEWKTVKVNMETLEAVYTVDTTQVFIIHDTEGYYYKFRFLSYVNALNEKGYTTFEYQRL